MAKIQDTIIFTRPNTNTLFPSEKGTVYTDTTDPIRVLNLEMKAEGKRIRKSSTISEDKLTQTVIIEFDSATSKTGYYNNSKSVAAIKNRDSYCTDSSITISQSTKEI